MVELVKIAMHNFGENAAKLLLIYANIFVKWLRKKKYIYWNICPPWNAPVFFYNNPRKADKIKFESPQRILDL